MQDRIAEYKRLRADASYTDVCYDAMTTGLKATHIMHNFDPARGHYERIVRDTLFAHGHHVILESEKSNTGVKTPDGMLNGRLFDIKSVEGSGRNTIKRKLNEARSQGCAHVVLYYPNAQAYFEESIQHGYRQYLGVLRKEQKADGLRHVWVIAGSNIIVFR